MIKIYIIGHSNIDVYSVSLALQRINDSLSIAPRFTTDEEDINGNKYFIDKETVNIAYKNNSIVSILTNDHHSEGITYDDYYNNDILYINMRGAKTQSEFSGFHPEQAGRRYSSA